MTAPDVITLHKSLVETPSISGNEAAITALAANILEPFGQITALERGLVAHKGNGPRVVLNSHLDTVPPNSKWTAEPWKATNVSGKITGLGSNDAKASVAAMMAAYCATPHACTLILGHQEETTGAGTESCLNWYKDTWGNEILGAVVGEPTELNIGTSQKGLLILNLFSDGDTVHAARATELNARNAIQSMARDITALAKANLGNDHPRLGRATIQPTVVHSGDIHNRLPHEAVVTYDVRTVPIMTHDEYIELIQSQVEARIEIRSKRLEPYACDEDALIVKAALRARPQAKLFGSATMSDQVFFQGIPCIKCGPGVSARSHTPDEFVMESEILEGLDFYLRLLEEAAQ